MYVAAKYRRRWPTVISYTVFVIYVTGTAELCRIRESYLRWFDAV